MYMEKEKESGKLQVKGRCGTKSRRNAKFTTTYHHKFKIFRII
jgi:hypothetical protein